MIRLKLAVVLLLCGGCGEYKSDVVIDKDLFSHLYQVEYKLVPMSITIPKVLPGVVVPGYNIAAMQKVWNLNIDEKQKLWQDISKVR